MPDEAEPRGADTLLAGRLVLHQPRAGHRAGTDGVLLAAAAPDGFAGHAIDLGAGVGTVGLILALRSRAARVDLVEDDPVVAACARRNIEANGLTGRVSVHEADLFDCAQMARLGGCADLVLTNPPYLQATTSRLPAEEGRRRAYVMRAPGLTGWIAAAAACLKPGGTLLAIHRADAVPALIAACGAAFGGLVLMPLLPDADQPARRVLLHARKGSGAPFVLAPPLVLHADGRFTPHVAAVHRGEAGIAWPSSRS